MKDTGLFFFFLLFISLTQCGERGKKPLTDYKPGKDEIADMNSYIVRKDRERIQSFFERKGLTMNETPTGLWFSILKDGSGAFFKDTDRIVFAYECSLLDGTECYNSEESGPMDIKLGHSDIPSGLTEGLKMLKPGAEALFILPPHLAYGLIGDSRKIPPRSTLVYSVKIIK